MPLYIAQSGDLDRCYRCLTDWLTTLKDRATQLLIKYKSGALVTQWALTDHEIYYIKIELDLRKFSNGLFSDTAKGFWVIPTPGGCRCTGVSSNLSWKWPRATLSALSLNETILSGWKRCLKMSEKRSSHAPRHDIQLGQKKFTRPATEVTLPATFANSFILLFHC